MINNKKPLHQIVTEKILNIFYSRLNPFSNINFVTNAYSKGEVGLEKLGPFQALKELKKRVSRVVEANGVTMYKGVSIWDISVYEMKRALPLIQYAVIKQDDYNFSPISKVRNPIYLTWIDKPDEIYNRLQGEENEYKTFARNVAKTEKEFEDLWFSCSRYKNDLYRIVSLTDKITSFIEKFSLNCYTGISLYDITDRDLLNEAFKALALVKLLQLEHHISHYGGNPIESLNYYLLKKIKENVEAENYEGLIIVKPDQPVKEEQLQSEETQIQAEKETRALREMIRRIVQAELKKADQKLVVKASVAKSTKKASIKTTTSKKD